MLRVRSLFILLAFASGLCAEPLAMKTREFKVDFNLREMGRSLAAPQTPPGGDPFAQPQEPAIVADPFGPPVAPAAGQAPLDFDETFKLSFKPPPILTSKDILTQMGISFPEGATSFYDSSTSTLRVHNTPEMLELIKVFFDSGGEGFPHDIVYSLTVVEGPGEIIRQTNAAAARVPNASAELRKLLDQAKQPASKVRVVSDAWLQAKSGTRATARAAVEHIHDSGLTFNAQGHATLKREMQPLGLELELEPTLGADGISIDTPFRLQLALAPPELRAVSITDPGTGNAAEYSTTDFSHAEFVTSISSSSGCTKLIGVTAPLDKATAREDRLWAAFLTATIHVQEPLPKPAPKPPSPGKGLPAGLLAAALHVPEGLLIDDGWSQPPRTLQGVLESQGVPATKGASAVQQKGVLQIINTPENIERISVLADTALEKAPKTIAFTLHTVQAPAALLRELAHASAAASDHAALWAQVEAAVARGEGRFIDSQFIETQSTVRAKNNSVSEHIHVEDFGLNAKGRPIPSIAYRNVGSILEIEPELHADGRTANVTLSYELHPARPATRREAFRDPASGLRFDLPVTDFHSLRTVTSLVMTKGGTRLLSLYPPTGRDAEGMLWATFLKCEVVTQVLPPKERPLPASFTTLADPRAWRTRTYKVPPDFLASAGSVDSLPSVTKSSKKPHTAQYMLEAAGILFPKGATAIFDPLHALLIVRNTQENLDLVEAYVTGLDDSRWPTTLAYTAQVFQGPGPLLRQLTTQAAGQCDHRSMLDALLTAVKAGTVQTLDTARIETKPGTQATTTQAREHLSLGEVKVNDQGETEFIQDTRQIGLILTIEPTWRAAGRAIESNISLEFHPAEPQEHREHILDSQGRSLELPLTDYQVVHLTTTTLIPSGAARLIGLWKPTGKPEFEQEDILQMLIITLGGAIGAHGDAPSSRPPLFRTFLRLFAAILFVFPSVPSLTPCTPRPSGYDQRRNLDEESPPRPRRRPSV
ncbi:MAG: hypothetical protein NTY98_16850 [Verrucomicrobia bacterium]|nr:hypothetical protein [Verrucomicrobiota bacterium]